MTILLWRDAGRKTMTLGDGCAARARVARRWPFTTAAWWRRWKRWSIRPRGATRRGRCAGRAAVRRGWRGNSKTRATGLRPIPAGPRRSSPSTTPVASATRAIPPRPSALACLTLGIPDCLDVSVVVINLATNHLIHGLSVREIIGVQHVYEKVNGCTANLIPLKHFVQRKAIPVEDLLNFSRPLCLEIVNQNDDWIRTKGTAEPANRYR